MAGRSASPAVPADAAVRGARTSAQIVDELDVGLAGSLNLRRTALRLLTSLRPELADWAMLVMPDGRSGGIAFLGGRDVGHADVVTRRRFGEDDIALAERIAARAAIALDSARLYEESARVATVLTRSLRPPTLPGIDGIRLAARYRPAAEHLDLGGDFYDVFGAGDDWLLAMGDVCGKGVEAAAVTGRTRQSIRTAAHFDRTPAKLLHALNTVLHDGEPDLFVTLVCARLRPRPGGHADVELATAGHPAPVVLRTDGRVEQLDILGKAAGMVSDVRYATATLRLDPGDTMLLFTDGVDEARGAAGLYGVERLSRRLSAYRGAAPEVICEAVEQDVVEYLDGTPHDDIALLAVTCGR